MPSSAWVSVKTSIWNGGVQSGRILSVSKKPSLNRLVHTANGDAGFTFRDVAEDLRAVPVGRCGDHGAPAAAGYVRPCSELAGSEYII